MLRLTYPAGSAEALNPTHQWPEITKHVFPSDIVNLCKLSKVNEPASDYFTAIHLTRPRSSCSSERNGRPPEPGVRHNEKDILESFRSFRKSRLRWKMLKSYKSSTLLSTTPSSLHITRTSMKGICIEEKGDTHGKNRSMDELGGDWARLPALVT